MKLGNKNIKAKRIRIVFDNSAEDYWDAASESGIEFDVAMRMIARAWEERDKPKDPLIKDEKIRKAFRAWAETLGDHGDTYKYDAERFSFNSHIADSTIEFAKTADIKCEDRQLYTLEELCGDD
jgi:hypothetical protein